LLQRLYKQRNGTDKTQLILKPYVVQALGRFGTNATIAVLELEKALPCPDPFTHQVLTNAIMSIKTGNVKELSPFEVD
jgi:hypothetical protein